MANGAGEIIPPTPVSKLLSWDPHCLLHPDVAPRGCFVVAASPEPIPREGPCLGEGASPRAGGFILVARGLGRVALHPSAPCPTPGPCRAPAAPSPELIGSGNPVPAQRRKPDSPDVHRATPIAFFFSFIPSSLQTEELPEWRRAPPDPRHGEQRGWREAAAQPWRSHGAEVHGEGVLLPLRV